jgi:hypothetical protein
MIKTAFLIIGIAIISIGFIPLFEYGSEWPELDQAPNVQLYPYIWNWLRGNTQVSNSMSTD